MKSTVLIISIITLAFPISIFSCDQTSLGESLKAFCSKVSKMEYDEFINPDSNSNQNFIYDSCGENYIYVYSPEEPYLLLRHPYRTFQNGKLSLLDKSNTSQDLAKKAVESKAIVSSKVNIGSKSLAIYKNIIALSCEIGSAKKNVIAVTSHYYTETNPFISALLFILPDSKADLNLTKKIIDASTPSDEKYISAYKLYDDLVQHSREIVAKNLKMDVLSVDAIMKNDFNKMRAGEFVLERVKETANPTVSDVQSALMSFSEKIFFDNPALPRIIELESRVKDSKSAHANVQPTVPNLENPKVDKEKIVLESELFTYAVSAAAIFLITTIVFAALYRKAKNA